MKQPTKPVKRILNKTPSTGRPISDYDLKYKHNLTLTQRVLYRFFNRLGKKK